MFVVHTQINEPSYVTSIEITKLQTVIFSIAADVDEDRKSSGAVDVLFNWRAIKRPKLIPHEAALKPWNYSILTICLCLWGLIVEFEMHNWRTYDEMPPDVSCQRLIWRNSYWSSLKAFRFAFAITQNYHYVLAPDVTITLRHLDKSNSSKHTKYLLWITS